MSRQECNIEKIIRVLSELEDDLKKIPQSNKASFNNNEQTNEIQSEKKKSPVWVRVRERFKFIRKVSNEASNHASDSGGSQGGSTRSRGNIDKEKEDEDLEIRKLQSDIGQMKAAITNLNQFQNKMIKSLEHELPSIKLTANLNKTVSMRSRSDNLKDIRKKIFNLKCEIPSLLYKQSSNDLSNTDSQTGGENGEIDETGIDIFLPGLHVSKAFRDTLAFEEVVEKFESLDFTQKLCLLSLAVFPENRELNKTMLMYWWIGEGFISCDDSENAEMGGILVLESSVTRILDKFSAKGLLETVEDERKLKPSSYKMEPHVHSAVIYLAKSMDMFKLYGEKGKLIMEKSSKAKVCLVRGSSLLPVAEKSKMKQEKLQTVFNSSERYPDFTFKWFKSMNSLKVLYLGRWERTATRHIEVESTEFLKYMKFLKNLRLASFQGISRIEKLENKMCELPELVILDLKACYNLEGLPEDIGLLKHLIYLDVSECYMLDRMPKGIANLSKLQVLKGFVISESDDESNCAVKHLVKLRKLSITVNKYSFKVESLMKSLTRLERLESLKIAWGARFQVDDQKVGEGEETDEAEEYVETTDEEEYQKGPETEDKHKDLKEQEDDEVEKKGQTSEEKKGDVGEMDSHEDGVSSKKEDGSNEKANQEEGKKHDEAEAESLKSNKVIEEEKKTSPSQEAMTETIQSKPDEQKGENKVEKERDGDNKKQDEVEAESLKSEKKESPSQETTGTIQNKPEDQKGKSNVEEDEDKGKAHQEEGNKQDHDVQAENSKQDNKVLVGEKKASHSQESSDMIQKKPDDKSKVEKEGDGDKGKADQDEGKKQDEVEEGKISKSDKVVKKDEKKSPTQETKDTIQRKADEITEVEKEGDGNKGKVNQEEGKRKDEVETENLKPENGVEGPKKASPSHESEENVNLQEVKKKNEEVKTDSSKSDKVIEGDEKQSPPPQDDHREISEVEEKVDKDKNGDDLKKLDGEEAKTQTSKKSNKLGKKVSFAENSPSPSRPHKESKLSKANWFMAMGNQTKNWGRRQEYQAITDIPTLPSTLKKLELECFPKKNPPSWLNPIDLNNLEKLSIKGGKLSRINDKRSTAEYRWRVQTLRLKYLHEFKVEWRDLQALFPDMTLLEKYQCPKISFCPTDGNGVWRKP